MFITRWGKPPRISQTPSAARSMVTAVGPRPTRCCPGASSVTRRMYSAILRRVRGWVALLVLVLAAAALAAGCGRGEPAPGARSAAAPAASEPAAPATQDPPAADERLAGSPRALAARLSFVSRRLRASIDDWLATGPGART